MTLSGLESPSSENDLYLARGDDVPVCRPIATGDVFADVPLTIGGPRSGLAIVLTHPCSMRLDGVHLVNRLLVAPVQEGPVIQLNDWRGHYRIMPLPGLVEARDYSARFLDLESVDSGCLETGNRVAILHPRGVNLLLQRLVHHMSRVAVPTAKFDEACAGVFVELDIFEDWCEAAQDAGLGTVAAAAACHDWLRTNDGDGVCAQERLLEPQQRAAVRRAARTAARTWIEENIRGV